MKKQAILTLFVFHIAVLVASATIEINFDTDADGNPFVAPSFFAQTLALTEFYAPLGVHFSGPESPVGMNGGAILDQAGNFGVDAHSGRNFLAFNRMDRLMDQGVPRDPETITFDTLMSSISIYAAGGPTSKTFFMQGFDDNGLLVATDTVITQGFSQLQIAWPLGIRSVQLSVQSTDFLVAFVFDDLSAEAVPEPSTIAFLISAAAIGLALQLRRRRA